MPGEKEMRHEEASFSGSLEFDFLSKFCFSMIIKSTHTYFLNFKYGKMTGRE
jgi:hypothetical protein